jgi:hypothetical protein
MLLFESRTVDVHVVDDERGASVEPDARHAGAGPVDLQVLQRNDVVDVGVDHDAVPERGQD